MNVYINLRTSKTKYLAENNINHLAKNKIIPLCKHIRLQPFLCLLMHHAIKIYKDVQLQLHVFLISPSDRGDSQLEALTALPLGKELPAPIRWESVWVPGPVWTLWRREKSPACPCWELNPDSSAIQSTA
jgi:hypothetical protein